MRRLDVASFRRYGTVVALVSAAATWGLGAYAAAPEAQMELAVVITGSAGTQTDTVRIVDDVTVSYDRDGPLYRVAFEARRADRCAVVIADVRYSPSGFELVPLKAVPPPRRVRVGEAAFRTSTDSERLELSLTGSDSCDAEQAPSVGDSFGRCIGVMTVPVEEAKVSRRMRDQLADAPEGVVVWYVFPRSPAAAADLRQGDILASLNGATLKSVADFTSAMRSRRAGESFDAELYRRGEWLHVEVVAGERKFVGSSLQCGASEQAAAL